MPIFSRAISRARAGARSSTACWSGATNLSGPTTARALAVWSGVTRYGWTPALRSRARACALHRDDPEGALAAAEEFLASHHASGVQRNAVPGLLALAAGLRARLGDDHGALPAFRDAVAIARDHGTPPPSAAALGFALNPLCRTGNHDVAATLIGGLECGAVAHVAGFPGTADHRALRLARIRDTLGGVLCIPGITC